jgi:hypothetical protein
MITINTDKGLIRIQTWEDVATRAGFTPDLDPVAFPLKAIIGRYVFGDQVRCGLKNCHTLHNHGYIVNAENGQETNIGKDCGKRYFSVDFEQVKRQFDRDMDAIENRDLLWSLTFKLDEIDERIVRLRSGAKGADWIFKNCRALQDPGKLPVDVTRQIDRFVKNQSGHFRLEREATEKQAEDMDALAGRKLPRPQYVPYMETVINGIEALYQENNLNQILIVGLQEQIKVFRLLSIDQLTEAQLRYWKKWGVTVDQLFEIAERSIEHGLVLLTHDNLAPLLRIDGLEKNGEADRFRAFLAKL